MNSTRRGRLVSLAVLAICTACSRGDGYYETDEHRPKAGIVNEREPLVMSDVSSSARFGDTITYTMPVGLLLGTEPMEFAASVAPGGGDEKVAIAPSRIELSPGTRGALDVTVTMPGDAAGHDNISGVTVDVTLESEQLDGTSISTSGRIHIEIADDDMPLGPTAIDDFAFWEGPQIVDVLSNDAATEARIEASSLRLTEMFPPFGDPAPVVQDGRISIPERPPFRGEGAYIDYEICSADQQCSRATLTLFIEGTF